VENYDKFLPSEETLAGIRNKLITIDIRWALLYGSFETRLNMIGRIYERLIDDDVLPEISLN
jgi:hypothetical protein